MRRSIRALLAAMLFACSGGVSLVASEASITLNESNPLLGDVVSFTVVAPKGVKIECNYSGNCARVEVACMQPVPFDYAWPDGSVHLQTDPVVYAETRTAEYNSLQLGGAASVWLFHGGAASCVATLYELKKVKGQSQFIAYASTSFEAGSPY